MRVLNNLAALKNVLQEMQVCVYRNGRKVILSRVFTCNPQQQIYRLRGYLSIQDKAFSHFLITCSHSILKVFYWGFIGLWLARA